MIRRCAAGSRRARTRTRCLAAAIAAAAGLSLVLPGGALAEPGRQAPLTGGSVTIMVRSVTPPVPLSDDHKHDLTVELELVNNTDQSLQSVTVDAVRGVPIETEQQLDAAIAHPQPPQSLSVPITPKGGKPVTAALSARGSTFVTYTTDTDIPQDAGLCICHNAIYPIYLTAHTTDAGGNDVSVGNAQTYVPVFYRPDLVQPMQVSWLWPILDRPHRLVDEQAPGQPPVFVDDDLADSVLRGRLSRVLQVLEGVAGRVPMTVVIDPELIDELAVMAAGKYVVRVGDKDVTGAGTSAARDWLDRLRSTLALPGIEVSYTPFADPDVESLTRSGLSWTESLGATAQQRVSTALGDPQQVTSLYWPVDEQLSSDTLETLVRQGTTTVVLNDTALPAGQQTPAPNGLAELQTAAGSVSALVTAADVQRYVAPAISVDATGEHGLAELPELVSELAVRTIENGQNGGYLPIVPPRFVDPDPGVAVPAILATMREFWNGGVTATQAVARIAPSNRGQLVAPAPGTGAPSPATLAAAQTLTRVIPALSTMLSASDAKALLGSLPAAVQRAESAGWRTDPPGADAFASALGTRIDTLESGVRIIQPSTGTYTLASSNSPLPITVENNLDVTVTVHVQVASVNGLPGFTAHDITHQVIPGKTRVTLHVPTRVERTGRFQVEAVLLTPSGEQIGAPVLLSVHSTALGLIGVVITIVAAVVLVLALLIRFVRRFRRRRRPGGPDPARRTQPEPVPV